jgi:hypothetical protein
VLFGVLNWLSGLSLVNECIGKCTWKKSLIHTYVFI